MTYASLYSNLCDAPSSGFGRRHNTSSANESSEYMMRVEMSSTTLMLDTTTTLVTVVNSSNNKEDRDLDKFYPNLCLLTQKRACMRIKKSVLCSSFAAQRKDNYLKPEFPTPPMTQDIITVSLF
jgi:hypothetical protein